MPNSLSAKKRVRQNEKQRVANRAKASALKTALRRVDEAVAAKDPAALTSAVQVAYQRIDKAALALVIHPNTAARRKSLVARKAARVASKA